jgi:hypothetical protein
MRDVHPPRFDAGTLLHAKTNWRHGLGNQVERLLTSEKLWLLHLLLHEIACHILGTTEQCPRDIWAFNEMEKHQDVFQSN